MVLTSNNTSWLSHIVAPLVTMFDGFLDVAAKAGVDTRKLYLDPRLVGKTKAAELLPKEIVNRFYRTPPVSSAVVPLTDKRPAMRVGKASGIFQPLAEVVVTPSANGIFTPLEGL